MIRTFKFRIYPEKDQIQKLHEAFGCVRFVYNNSLAYKKDIYYLSKVNISVYDLNNRLTWLKEDHEFLKKAPSQSLQQANNNLDTAFKNFYRKTARFPKFKSKHSDQSLSLPQGVKLDFKSSRIFIPKLKWTFGIFHRNIPSNAVIKTCTVSKTTTNKYFISILFEDHIAKPVKKFGKTIGIDLGIKDLITFSNSIKIKSGKYLDKYEEKLKYFQRKLSAKQKGSKNRAKARLKVAKVHEKISNCRDDQLHKITTRIINENQVIFLENLTVKSMMKTSNLAKKISDVSWRKLIDMLVYKAELYGKYVFKVNPKNTSKTCSKCLTINKKLTLNIRKWQCKHCQAKHDRDVNAARNVLQIGQGLPEYKALKAA